MTDIVVDIDRPDVNGIEPKMHDINIAVEAAVGNLVPFINLSCDDKLMSSIYIRGSFNAKENWNSRYWENSEYFRFSIEPEKNKRYYTKGEKVMVELRGKSHKIANSFRKFTGSPEKVIARIKEWILSNSKGRNITD